VILVDTDVLIWVLRGRDDVVESFERALEDTGGFLFITPIQVAEIFAGARKKELLTIEGFLSSLKLIVIDRDVGRLAGEFFGRYGKSHGTTLADSLIAAVAKSHGLSLWTMNRKHFPMFSDKEFYAG